MVELLSVLVAVGVLVSVTLPDLARAQRRFAAYVAARHLRADVARARQRAILDGSTVRVAIDTVFARYRIVNESGTVLFERGLGRGLILRTTAHRQEILFSPRGTSNLYSTTWVAVGDDLDSRWHGMRVIPSGAIETR